MEKDITTGVEANRFGPTLACNRAQVVTFLWRAADEPTSEVEVSFTDVVEGVFYYKAVLWAEDNGITTGTSETTFAPLEICNRAQVVTFLYRIHAE